MNQAFSAYKDFSLQTQQHLTSQKDKFFDFPQYSWYGQNMERKGTSYISLLEEDFPEDKEFMDVILRSNFKTTYTFPKRVKNVDNKE